MKCPVCLTELENELCPNCGWSESRYSKNASEDIRIKKLK